MSKALIGRFSLVHLLAGANALLALGYIALIAVVMSYAAMHVEFAQEVRSDEAAVATLESSYLASLDSLTSTDYGQLGYVKPATKIFVEGNVHTAINAR